MFYCSITHLPCFIDEVSILTHFFLESGYKDYSFLNQVVADFELWFSFHPHWLQHNTSTWCILWWAWCCDFSVSPGFLHWVTKISDNSKPQLAPSIKSHELRCQNRELILPVPVAGKMSASELIYYFSSHPATFGFQPSSPLDKFTVNPANKKTDRVFLIFRLALVQLSMPLWIQDLFLIWELHLLIGLSSYNIVMKALLQLLKGMNYLTRFMTLLRLLCLNCLVIELVFSAYLFNSASRQHN